MELNKEKLVYTCGRGSELTARLVDNLLIPLAHRKDGLGRVFRTRVQNEYPHLIGEFGPEVSYGLQEQYVAFQVLGPQGLLRKYLQDPEVKRRSAKDRRFLEAKLFSPWQYVFMQIERDLGDDIYEMVDVLTEDSFILFSPGVGKYEAEGKRSMYFSLLSFNGECYQTYGPIIGFAGLHPLDLEFYGLELNKKNKTVGEVEDLLQADPLPFIMLIVGANYPLTYHKQDLLLMQLTELELGDLNLNLGEWEKYFKIEQQDGVYLFDLKRWWQFPHFAHCSYAPEDRKFVAFSMTERGWEKLVNTVHKLGIDLSLDSQICTTALGDQLVNKVLGQSGARNPYASLFTQPQGEIDGEELAALNHFLALLIPRLNNAEEYDLHDLADQAGISYENAEILLGQIERKKGL